MSERDHRCLHALPEVVELWRVLTKEEEKRAVFYLTQERAMDGLLAAAHSCVCALVEHMAVRREHVLAVDLDRYCAQVVLDV